jgi:hypothetical protein
VNKGRGERFKEKRKGSRLDESIFSHQFKYKLINIFISVFEPELTLFEMKIKGCFGNTVKPHDPLFA